MAFERVKVTLHDDAYRVVRRLSELTGKSMSAVISGVLQPVIPSMDELADLFQKAVDQQAVDTDFIRTQFHESVGDFRALLDSAPPPRPKVVKPIPEPINEPVLDPPETISPEPLEPCLDDDDYQIEQMEAINEEW